MARDFVIQSEFTPMKPGAVAPYCAQCGVDPANKKFVVRTNADTEFMYEHRDKQLHSEGKVQFCSDCSERLAAQIQWISPQEAAKLKGQVLKAEAARAKAEKAQAKAEAALFAMQDWVAADEQA